MTMVMMMMMMIAKRVRELRAGLERGRGARAQERERKQEKIRFFYRRFIDVEHVELLEDGRRLPVCCCLLLLLFSVSDVLVSKVFKERRGRVERGKKELFRKKEEAELEGSVARRAMSSSIDDAQSALFFPHFLRFPPNNS